MNIENTLQLITVFRENVNKHQNKLLDNFLNKHQLNILCSSMDIIEDSILAIKYYIKNGLGKEVGEKYLKLYGLLQSVIIQQDAIEEMYKLVGITNPSKKEGFSQIRQVRIRIAGHPSSSGHGFFCSFLSRCSFDDKELTLITYNVQQDKDGVEYINISKLLEEHFTEINEKLDELIKIYDSKIY